MRKTAVNIIPPQKNIILPWLKIHPLLLTSFSTATRSSFGSCFIRDFFYAALMQLSLLKSRRVMSLYSVKKKQKENGKATGPKWRFKRKIQVDKVWDSFLGAANLIWLRQPFVFVVEGKCIKELTEVPGKTARHNAAGPDGGRQVRCIVGPVGDFFFRDTSYAHLLWLAHTQRECCPCPCQICVCVCVPVPAFDQTFIIGPSSSFDTNSARCRHANQPLYFCAVSHFVSRWQPHADASHDSAECTNH